MRINASTTTTFTAIVLLVGLFGCGNANREVSVEDFDVTDKVRIRATVNGKYSGLLKVLRVPEDGNEFGEFRDWGLWEGSEYKEFKELPKGYWVYVSPYWFIWKEEKLII